MRHFTRWSRFLALVVAIAVVAAGGVGIARAQDDAAGDAGPAGQPPLGSPISFISAEGTEAATITVTNFADPFEAYDPSVPPERGYRFVEVGITVENTGRRPFSFNAYSIYLQDTEGFLYPQTFAYRSTEEVEQHPDYTSEDVAGGESLSGFIYFSVFSDAEIVRVVYTDGFERLIFLGDLTVDPLIELGHTDAAGATGTDGEDGEDGTDGEDGEDGEDVAALDLSEEECAEVTTFIEDSETRFEALDAGFEALFTVEDPDPAALRDLSDQLEVLAGEQADADAPEVAQPANDAVVALLAGFATAIDEYADLVESGEATDETVEALFTELDPLVAEAEALTTQLEDACGIDIE